MNTKKIIIMILISMFVIINNYVYGAFADYTDEQAELDTQKLIEEHNNNFDHTKSNNNYLKNLNVQEGDISPSFDKQTIEYSLTLENNIEEINIFANAEDDKASINGIGKVNIKNNNKCNIDVIAESGTVRTYYINIIKSEKSLGTTSNNAISSEKNNTSPGEESDFGEKENISIGIEKNANITESNLNDQKYEHENKKYIIVAICISIIIMIVFIFFAIHKNKKIGKN